MAERESLVTILMTIVDAVVVLGHELAGVLFLLVLLLDISVVARVHRH